MSVEILGKFEESLQRNNSSIRKDRASAISEDTAITYKREVEDLEIAIKKLKREREGMLDLSPTDANSLMIASDFDAKDFVAKDIEIGVRLRNYEIKLEIATTRYNYLFGKGE